MLAPGTRGMLTLDLWSRGEARRVPLVPYLLPPGLCPAAERGGLTVYSDIALDSSSLCNVQVDIHSTARLSHFTLDLSLAHHL